MKTRILAGLTVLLWAYSAATAATRSVPGEHVNIQEAIDEAAEGDMIIVAPGTYHETIDFKGKNIVVRSTDPNDPQTVAATVISFRKVVPRGTRLDGSVVTFANGEGPAAVLAGFTITGGLGTFLSDVDVDEIYWGAGILCAGASPSIVCNVLTENNGPPGDQGTGATPTRYGYGGAIACIMSDAVIARNVVRNNSAYAGGGILVYAGAARIANNLIYDNLATAGGGVLLLHGGNLVNNTVFANAASTGGGLYLISDPAVGHYQATNNIICNARTGGGIVWESFTQADRIAFNDVWGNTGGTDLLWAAERNVDGNISGDPMLLSPQTGDFRLHMDSPCVNAGDPDYFGQPGETDFYGDPRIHHGRVDVGAAEFAGQLRPVADAGPDQSMTVIPDVITLDAGSSYDPDGQGSPTCTWSQVGGPAVTLDVDGPLARFSPAGYGIFTFELVVNDGVFDSLPDMVHVVVDDGHLPIADAGRPVYAGNEPVTLNAAGSHDPDHSGPLHYHWRQLSGPVVQIDDANSASPTVSGFARSGALQVGVFELTVDDGEYVGLPDSVEVRIVPNTPGISMANESGSFDASKPTVVYFGGGDCITGGGAWGSAAWSQRANVLSFSYGPDATNPTSYERCGDAIVWYLSQQAPDYKMPIQTMGFSTGGQPAIDAARRLNLTYRDARYAVNRITFVDGRCRDYSSTILEYLYSSVDGEQCWIDSYDSAPVFYPGILNAHVSNGNHGTPPAYYRTSLTHAQMNDFNGGLVAGAYWSVIGPGKNLQLALAPREQIYAFRGYDAVSPGYGYMLFYDEANSPGRLPEPVRLLPPVDVGDPCGVVLTCAPSQNAAGYELLFGRDPHRVMDFNIVSDTPGPPEQVISTLPCEQTWWTVRVRDAYGSTIYADPVPLRAFNLTLPVENLTLRRRYATIQDAIDEAGPADELVLQPGVYHENVNLGGKDLILRSLDPADPGVVEATIIDADGSGAAVTCLDTVAEGPTLDGLTLTNGENGLYCSNAVLTMTRCLVTGNRLAGIKLWDESHLTAGNCTVACNGGAGVEMWCDKVGRIIPYNHATVTNCTIVENAGDGIWGGKPTVTNSILWNNGGVEITGDVVVVTYSDVQGGHPGTGNIDADPEFVQPGRWDGANGLVGDYHLRSQGWRWDSGGGVWTTDGVTSPCIDAGDPASALGDEPLSLPAGPVVNERINMGAYGGTSQASVAP
ncbi:MAG: right-handed parallel beta-helix repeat-containing protein [Sedimentisphaerales bacterium]|nr:right-handed parallel beta-helix repeat-containing protein [Sedimentisphaerales bacterium]